MIEEKVSVIIAVYNTERYLEKCLDSVMSQDYENIELVLVDDGSTDKSLEIMEGYRNRYPDRITVLRKENGGQASARNLALGKITGTYLTFMDSDDYIDPDYIRTLVTAAVENGSDAVISGQYKVTSEGVVKDTISYKVSGGRSPQRRLNIAGKLYRTDYIREHNITFPEGKLYEDNSFNLLALFLSPKILVLPYEGYYQVIREGSTTAKLIDCSKLPFDNWEYCIRTVKESGICGVDMELFDFTVISFFTYFLMVRNKKREYLPNEKKNSIDNALEISDRFEKMTNVFFDKFRQNRYIRLFRNSELPLKQKLGVRVFYSFASKNKLRNFVRLFYKV
ncbi:MAG: glycosyltransferase family 2 protein [Clostridiales bacterium]|nr:glycosyltransferase family 2 protein [Clostridiales bacterium]